MKKKGFTLVELLAVIAILAILVIIALPNVMALFNEAKKNSFINELKEIYKTAQNQWMSDSLINTQDQYYSRGSTGEVIECGSSSKTLQLSGRTQLQYAIKVSKSGEVLQFKATDGTYMYDYAATGTVGIKIEDVGTTPAVTVLSETNYTGASITCANGVFSITGTN